MRAKIIKQLIIAGDNFEYVLVMKVIKAKGCPTSGRTAFCF